MEYVYAAMLLHSAEKDIDEDGVSSVLSAAGVEVDGARVKALVTSLGDVDIGEAMATAVAAPVAAAPAAAGGGGGCLLYTSPSPRDLSTSRMPSSA